MEGRSRIVLGFHLVGLCTFSIAQPLFDVLGRSPEFFVAHRASPADLLGLIAVLIFTLPAICMLVVALADRIDRRAGSTVAALALGGLAAVFALQALKRVPGLDASAALAIAFVAGLALAVLWWRSAAVGTLLTIIAAGALVFPVLFAGQSSIRKLLLPGESAVRRLATVGTRTPVVMVVFDQLPLSSLIGADGLIEREAYPSFSALATHATWYRNASTVNPVTGWALPAIVTGNRPRADSLPVAADHPNSLFTLLAATHGMHVVEPITDLCPEDVCPPSRDPLAVHLSRMLIDLSIVFLHLTLPDDLTARLPSVTDDWKDFAADQNWQRRFEALQRSDRSGQWEQFVDSIRREDRPMLHFIHILLPHDPFVYLPSGQRYTYDQSTPGLSPDHYWTRSEWAATEGYRRHLLQVAFVDRLLGSLVDRLQRQGIYDEALIVVTADHGAGFRPGGPLRNVDLKEPAAVMSVPLFIKRPFQREGATDDRNVETIDILPTIAAILGTELPWASDGAPVTSIGHVARPYKELSFERATRVLRLDESMFDDDLALARRKDRLFRPGDTFRRPVAAAYADLIGRRVDAFPRGAPLPGVIISIRGSASSEGAEEGAPFLPAQISGSAVWPSLDSELALAFAVDGTIQATMRIDRSADNEAVRWSTLLPPPVLVASRNAPVAYVVTSSTSEITLHPTTGVRLPASINLISDEARRRWGVEQSGLYATEHMGQTMFRWSNGHARIVVPVDSPRRVHVSLLLAGSTGTDLQIRVNGCEVFADHIPNRPWSRDFDLGRCGTLATPATIEIESGAVVPDGSDKRTLGVAIEKVEMH